MGDVGGVRIPPEPFTIPPTPPPDIDVEAWHESIALIRAWEPQRLAMTHFGAADDVEDQLAALDRRLDEYAQLARDGGREQFVSIVQAQILREGGPDLTLTYEQAAPIEQLYAGYERYWSKRA